MIVARVSGSRAKSERGRTIVEIQPSNLSSDSKGTSAECSASASQRWKGATSVHGVQLEVGSGYFGTVGDDGSRDDGGHELRALGRDSETFESTSDRVCTRRSVRTAEGDSAGGLFLPIKQSRAVEYATAESIWVVGRVSRVGASRGRTHLVAGDVVGNILENLVGSGSNLGFRSARELGTVRGEAVRLTVDSPEAWELIRTKGVAT